jgi:hypothetical protein
VVQVHLGPPSSEALCGRPGLGPYRNSRGQRPPHLESRAFIAPGHPYPNPDRLGHQDPPPPPPAPPPTPPPPLLPLEEGSWLAALAAEPSLGAIWE